MPAKTEYKFSYDDAKADTWIKVSGTITLSGVAEDVKSWLCAVKHAREDYGVSITMDVVEVDKEV